MKKIFRFKAIILTFLLVFINFSNIFAEIEKESHIKFEEFPILNYENINNGVLQTEIYNNQLYVMWTESGKDQHYEIKIKKYDGTKWNEVDTNLLNNSITVGMMGIYLEVYNNELYVVWDEYDGIEDSKLRMKKYCNDRWIEVDPASLNDYNNIISWNNELYYIWEEYDENNVIQLRVAKNNGTNLLEVDNASSEFVEIDNGSLNYDTSKNAEFDKIEVFNNELYIIWDEYEIKGWKDKKIKKYNEGKWIEVDTSFSKNGADKKAIMYNNELYLMWAERNKNEGRKIKVKKYDGIKWIDVDKGFLNYDSSKDAFFPEPIIYKGDLYVSWVEYDKNGNRQIRMKILNGNKLVQIGNGSLNYDSNKSSTFSKYAIIYNNELYIIWDEDGDIRLKKLINNTKTEDKTKH
ncbi:hypothetical protein [Tepidibacter hydrothermalis]|uniref:DUF5050 domain-containing protein n=1 Tax=Tepidibacter hydrothermalis TaxID=3036126 RepID=A0ABY8E761_9FIRM|nr:hypothetical protein [Tepidibacter hydrothermalis]WFD08722.1 hypothetical protein P4S50_09955 [Tepidibacter hydrothermalis]